MKYKITTRRLTIGCSYFTYSLLQLSMVTKMYQSAFIYLIAFLMSWRVKIWWTVHNFITACIRCLRESNVFSHVCLSVCLFTRAPCDHYPWCHWLVKGYMGTSLPHGTVRTSSLGNPPPHHMDTWDPPSHVKAWGRLAFNWRTFLFLNMFISYFRRCRRILSSCWQRDMKQPVPHWGLRLMN